MKKLILITAILLNALFLFGYGQSNLNSGLAAYYPFNGNAIDESGNQFDGVVDGATLTTDRFGNPNKAYFFNGSNSKITLPSGTTILGNNPSEWSLNLWINSSSFVSNNGTAIFTDYYSDSYDTTFGLQFESRFDKKIDVQVRKNGKAGGTQIVVSSTVTVKDQWYMLTMTASKITSSLKLYINGTFEGQVSLDPTINYFQDTQMLVGTQYFSGFFHAFFNGSIDDIRIYNRALTNNEIQQLFDDKPSGLVAYYPFNGNANDASGNGFDGVVNGATLTSDRFGNPNQAYFFDGSGNISIDSLPIDFPNISVSFWVSTDDTIQQRRVIEQNWSAGSFTSDITVGDFRFIFGTPGSQTEALNLGKIKKQEWHLVTFTYDGSIARGYLDGILKSSFNDSRGLRNTTEPLFIGARSPLYFKGSLDDIRIYNRVLTDQEIKALNVMVQPLIINDNNIHIKDNLSESNTSANIFQRIYNGLYSINRGPNDLIGDVTISVDLPDTIQIDSVKAFASSPDDSTLNISFNLIENSPGVWEARIPIRAEVGIDVNSFIEIIQTVASFLGNLIGETVNPFKTVGIKASRLDLFQIIVKTSSGNMFVFNQNTGLSKRKLPTYDRIIGDELLKLPQNSGVFSTVALSPIDILITDDQGRKLGVQNGQQFNEIPNSIATGDGEPEAIFLFGNGEYNIEIKGTNTGSFNLKINQNFINSNSGGTEVSYENVPVQNTTTVRGIVGAFYNDYTMEVDDDGDGFFESTLNPSRVTSISKKINIVQNFSLAQNYPNPFNPTTTIEYALPKTAAVKLVIYNTLGQVVRTLLDKQQSAGSYNVVWDGKNERGNAVASGLYIYRIKAGRFVQTRKMLLMK